MKIGDPSSGPASPISDRSGRGPIAMAESHPEHPRSFGLCLAEIMVAIAILALAMIPLLSVFWATCRHAAQTSDYSLGLGLVTKASEDLLLGNWENAHWIEELEQDPSFGAVAPVVDGESPFFATLEDMVPPYGLIEPGKDPGILPSVEPLFSRVKKYRLGLQTTPESLPTTGAVLNTHVKLEWTAVQGQRQTISAEVVLGRYASRPSLPEVICDRPLADSMIRGLFYPDRASLSLDEAIRQVGADPETIRRLGDIAILCSVLDTAAAKIRRDCQPLVAEARNGSSEGKVSALLTLGRLYERYAALCLNSMAAIRGPLRALADGFRADLLGRWGGRPSVYLDPLISFLDVPNEFSAYLWTAHASYTLAYNLPSESVLRPRLRTRVFMKLVEIGKLAAMTGRPEALTGVVSIVESFLREQDGRNPNFFRFARYELLSCRDPALFRLRGSDWRFGAWDGFEALVLAAAIRVGGTVSSGAAPSPSPRSGSPVSNPR